MNRDNLGKCRVCGRRIRFIKMQSGNAMPVDEVFVNYKLMQGGKDRIVTPDGRVVACVSEVCKDESDGYGYVSHFATCSSYKKK